MPDIDQRKKLELVEVFRLHGDRAGWGNDDGRAGEGRGGGEALMFNRFTGDARRVVSPRAAATVAVAALTSMNATMLMGGLSSA